MSTRTKKFSLEIIRVDYHEDDQERFYLIIARDAFDEYGNIWISVTKQDAEVMVSKENIKIKEHPKNNEKKPELGIDQALDSLKIFNESLKKSDL